MSEIKALSGVEIKSMSEGRVTARFATYNELDYHGDITRKGAFQNDQEVVVSSYNHTSWGGALPVGKARVRDGGDGVYADIQFFMNTQAGRDTFETVKEVGSLQQWSYGFDIEKKSEGTIKSEDGEREVPVRYIEKVKVHEVSPVLLGAGKSTATVAVKDGLYSMDKLSAAGYSIEDIIELLEEKAKKPKDDDYDKDKDDKPKDGKKPKDKDDDEEEEDDDKRKKPKNSGKMRMSDQTEDVVTDLKALADRAEEIMVLRKSEGKTGVSVALQEQFYELLKQADRIFALVPKDEDGFFANSETKAADDERAEVENIYLSLLSEEL